MSLSLSSDAPAPAPVRVNKRELAQVLGVSVPTINAWLDRHEGFPIVQEGTNGREWQFDAIAVRAFLDDRRAEEEREEARRQAAIAQLGLPLDDVSGEVTSALSGKERLQELRALKAEDDLRVQRGYLVSVPETRTMLGNAIGRWNRAIHAAILQAGRDMNLPATVIRALDDRLDETQRGLVRDLRMDLEPDAERHRIV